MTLTPKDWLPMAGSRANLVSILVTLLVVIGCNSNTFSGSGRSGNNSPAPGSNRGTTDGPQAGSNTPTGSDRANGSAKRKPSDKIDSSSEESCKNTLVTTGFKDPINGRTYRMLEGRHNFCKGHKLCDEIDPNSRFPIIGEKASDDILRCGSSTKSWLDTREDQKELMCDGDRIKPGISLTASDTGSAKGLNLYTFEADRFVSPEEKSQIICVYQD